MMLTPQRFTWHPFTWCRNSHGEGLVAFGSLREVMVNIHSTETHVRASDAALGDSQEG
jgi:hypothetical protein